MILATVIPNHSIVVCVVVISLHHDGSADVPQYVVVHGCVSPFIGTAGWPVHSDSIFVRVMDPIVGNVRVLLFIHHHLNNGSIRLQQSRIPNFVVHHCRCIPNRNGCRRTCTMHRVVGERIVFPTIINGDHQSRCIAHRPVDVREIGIVDCIVVGLSCSSMKFNSGPICVQYCSVFNQ